MAVFIEYVLIDNFVIDYILLSLSIKIVGCPKSKLKLCIVSAMGAIFSLVYPLFDLIKVIEIVVKLLFGALMVAISSSFNNARSYYITAIIFNALTFLVGGTIIAVYGIFGIDYSSEISIALMILPVLVMAKFIKSLAVFLKNRKRITEYSYSVSITVKGKSIEGIGFLDTGNCAFDNDSPIVFCTKQIMNKFLDLGIIIQTYRISVKTVTGSLENIAFKADNFTVYVDNKRREFNSVTVCVSKNLPLNIDVLLHPVLMEDINVKETDKETKTAC